MSITSTNRLFPRRKNVAEFPTRELFPAGDPASDRATEIVNRVKSGGLDALLQCIEQYDGAPAREKLVYNSDDLQNALSELGKEETALLTRVQKRIESFAEAQLNSISELTVQVPGGTAGHRLSPVEIAGCYAPGGKYPLASSVLMTVIPARVCGVTRIWVASPRPTTFMLAAAGMAGAEAVGDHPFVPVARAENLLHGRADLGDTIARLQSFQEAGASAVYAPGLTTIDQVSAVVSSVDIPVNVLVGMPGQSFSLDDLGEAGVRRVSVGSGFERVANAALRRCAEQLLDTSAPLGPMFA